MTTNHKHELKTETCKNIPRALNDIFSRGMYMI